MTQRQPRPCTAAEAVQRALSLLADPTNKTHGYELGTGDYAPVGGIDLPWSKGKRGVVGADCRTAFVWCYRVPSHRAGYNHGSWSTVSDDVNYNSLIEDAHHEHDLVTLVTDTPREGDILAYPTIHLPGHPLPFIGHGAIAIGVSRVTAWDPNAPQFHLIDTMQVCGPPDRKPAAIACDGSAFDKHTRDWPKPEHRAWLLRIVP